MHNSKFNHALNVQSITASHTTYKSSTPNPMSAPFQKMYISVTALICVCVYRCSYTYACLLTRTVQSYNLGSCFPIKPPEMTEPKGAKCLCLISSQCRRVSTYVYSAFSIMQSLLVHLMYIAGREQPPSQCCKLVEWIFQSVQWVGVYSWIPCHYSNVYAKIQVIRSVDERLIGQKNSC